MFLFNFDTSTERDDKVGNYEQQRDEYGQQREKYQQQRWKYKQQRVNSEQQQHGYPQQRDKNPQQRDGSLRRLPTVILFGVMKAGTGECFS